MAYNSRKIESVMSASAPLCLRVGASKTIGEYLIAPRIERFLRSQPAASFSLLVDNTQVLLQALEAGELDFVLVEGFSTRRATRHSSTGRSRFSASARRAIAWPGAPCRWTS